jgi:hypothetical protein
MPEISTYQPQVCPNEKCMGYGDTVPIDRGRCFLCQTLMAPYSEIPYEHVNPFVRRVLEWNRLVFKV